ncbi:MAG: hypothetical protein K0S07_697 [Chlamydiales bacterium]|jgi:hypothetical protein|nr:hypothetical protein [Chlamydiales bacterium]
MTKYYYLSTALPPLELETENLLSWHYFKELLQTWLSAADWEKLEVICQRYDIENLKRLWQRQPIDPLGNLEGAELESAQVLLMGLPEYILDFLRMYPSTEERLKFFPQLIARYFQESIASNSGFLKEYLVFEWQKRLVLNALRAKRLGRNLRAELQYEDPQDPFVAELLAQSDTPSFEPPYGFSDLKVLFDTFKEDPIALHRALLEYQFKSWRDLSTDDLFSIDRILSYVVKFTQVKRWQELDRALGLKIIDSIVKDVS